MRFEVALMWVRRLENLISPKRSVRKGLHTSCEICLNSMFASMPSKVSHGDRSVVTIDANLKTDAWDVKYAVLADASGLKCLDPH